MGPKTKGKNSRQWSPVEIDTFADVLADTENNYAVALDKLALKKSSNNEVFEHIRTAFLVEMEKEDFRVRNKEHFIRSWVRRSTNFVRSTSGSRKNGESTPGVQKMDQGLPRMRSHTGTKS